MNQLLSGVRILDLTQFLAGPYGSMLLGDLGAEVIKIEAPGRGDPMRQMPPHFLEGESAYFLSVNRNKRSVTLDLKHPTGREVFLDLVRVSDVVLDNFRPGVMQKLGLDYETLRRVNPRIIACSISGFGQAGPYRDRPAFDLVLQAMSGAMSITGEPGRVPVRMGIPMGDLAGGMFAAQAICAALYARERTGEGCYIDLGLLDCLTSLLTYVAQYYLASGEVPGPAGSQHQSVVPYGAFATADGYLVIAAFTEKFWQGICRALERPDLAEDPRFVRNALRVQNRDALMPILEAEFRKRTTAEWLARLEAEGVPCGPIYTVDQVLTDPQIAARNMLVHVQHPLIGDLPVLGNPVKVADAEERFDPPPLLGQHTEEVLREVLGYSKEKVAALREAGVI
jgi:crotonobetainyl-CoA:carnitine CoA-transferase CaiB-like acyl-CoA transferase